MSTLTNDERIRPVVGRLSGRHDNEVELATLAADETPALPVRLAEGFFHRWAVADNKAHVCFSMTVRNDSNSALQFTFSYLSA
jgi:hypothetical protein